MSDNFSLIIKNGNCYIQGKFQKIDLGLSGNKISKIGKLDNSNTKSIDADGKIVLPGVIDTQVHFREPGANNAENLESGSRAAVDRGSSDRRRVVAAATSRTCVPRRCLYFFV